jgi:hypothetical protein
MLFHLFALNSFFQSVMANQRKLMKKRAIELIVFSCITIALVLLPQHTAQARICYDSSKQPIPCPKSDYLLKQQAMTDVPPTQTLQPPTKTPEPSPTLTPTSVPTNTAIPTATQSSVLAIVPVGHIPHANSCDPRIWPTAAGTGLILTLTGVLARLVRARSARSVVAQGIAKSKYSTESQANESTLNVSIGKVDFEDPGSSSNPNPTAPIAVATTGIVLALGSAAGILNLIPCSSALAIAGGSVFVGLAAGMINQVIRKQGMSRYMAGRIKVTGNENLARKIKDEFDEQK